MASICEEDAWDGIDVSADRVRRLSKMALRDNSLDCVVAGNI